MPLEREAPGSKPGLTGSVACFVARSRRISPYRCFPLLCAALWLLIPAGAARSQEPAVIPRPTAQAAAQDVVTVEATAQVKVAPDTAVVSLGVDSERPTAAAASGEERRMMTAVVAAIRGTGVPENEIQTETLSLEPQYTQEQNSPPKLRGFRASNVVSVRLPVHGAGEPPANPAVGAVVDAALAAGANRIDSLQFLLQNDIASRAQALGHAAQMASLKARVIAEALGIKLGGVASVTEGLSETPFVAGRAPMMAAMAGVAAEPTPVLPGEITISGTVTVQYHIL